MKSILTRSLNSVRRPIALMLVLLPAGALAVSYALVQWSVLMTADGRITDPNLSMTIEGFGNLFRNYAIPVLVLSLVLAVVNLWCAFSTRPRECAVAPSAGC